MTASEEHWEERRQHFEALKLSPAGHVTGGLLSSQAHHWPAVGWLTGITILVALVTTVSGDDGARIWSARMCRRPEADKCFTEQGIIEVFIVKQL